MSEPTDPFAAWQKAALDATFACVQQAIVGTEQLFKLNVDTARNVLDQQTKAAVELLSIGDPQQLLAARNRLAQANMQQSAVYAQTVYGILSQAQSQMAKVAEEQFARLNEQMIEGAKSLGSVAPGSAVSVAVLKSSLAASAAIMEDLNRATDQFKQFSEASLKAATAKMVNSAK